MTTMESAFNLAGYFAARRPGLLLRARKEMEAALWRGRLGRLRRKVHGTGERLSSEEATLVVRYLGARRLARNRGWVFPGDRNWTLAGRRERRAA